MAQIHVSYGPPGTQGVQAIMGIGADELDAAAGPAGVLDRRLEKVGWVGIGVWGLGVILNKARLRHIGLGGALAALGVRYVAR